MKDHRHFLISGRPHRAPAGFMSFLLRMNTRPSAFTIPSGGTIKDRLADYPDDRSSVGRSMAILSDNGLS
jgi:hypothetical protein